MTNLDNPILSPDDLPSPECEAGFPVTQLEELLTEEQFEDLSKWMYGQTMTLCEGKKYNNDTKTYRESCDGTAHGAVIYHWDLKRWLQGQPIID
jgi:hypothetical protein